MKSTSCPVPLAYTLLFAHNIAAGDNAIIAVEFDSIDWYIQQPYNTIRNGKGIKFATVKLITRATAGDRAISLYT